MSPIRTLRNFVTTAALAIVTAGCALQPHINVPPLAAPVPGGSTAARLSAEIVRAHETQQLYMDAVSRQSAAINGTALALIPLSAAALAVGIANPGGAVTRNFLIGAGAGAATLIGLDTIFIDRRRDLVFYAGAKSLYCLRVAIAPVEVTDADLAQMERDVDELRLRLGFAAAANVDGSLLAQANTLFVAGRALVTNIRNAPGRFSNEIDNINIAVNAEINKTEPDLAKIIDTVGSLQKFATQIIPNFPGGLPSPPRGEGQGLRLRAPGDAAAALRQSIAIVGAWVAAYQGAIAETATKMAAEKCTVTIAGLPPAPTIIVAGNQPVTINPGPGGTPMLITPTPAPSVMPPSPRVTLPPPPPVGQPTRRVPSDPNDPLADLSDTRPNSLFKQLAARFKLRFPRTNSFKSEPFVRAVEDFQRCIKAEPTGRLTASQVRKVLDSPDPTICPTAAGTTAPAAGTGAAPSTTAPAAGTAATGAAPSTAAPAAGTAATGAAPGTAAPAAGTGPGAPVPMLPQSPNLGNR